jgi:hypothetical protein
MISLYVGKRFVNSFKRRGFLAHIVIMPFPILYRRKPLRGLKRWLTFLAPGSFFIYVTKWAGLWSVLLSPEQEKEKGCR